jgi:hypothetical protein
MHPPSSSDVPAASKDLTTQTITLVNSLQGEKNIMLKVKISYTKAGSKVPQVRTYICEAADIYMMRRKTLICGPSSNPKITSLLLSFSLLDHHTPPPPPPPPLPQCPGRRPDDCQHLPTALLISLRHVRACVGLSTKMAPGCASSTRTNSRAPSDCMPRYILAIETTDSNPNVKQRQTNQLQTSIVLLVLLPQDSDGFSLYKAQGRAQRWSWFSFYKTLDACSAACTL